MNFLFLALLFISCSHNTTQKLRYVSKPITLEVPKFGFTKIQFEEVRDKFFPINGNFLITNIKPERNENDFKYDLTKGFNRILLEDQSDNHKIPTSMLNSIGIKEGDVINYVNFEDGALKSYRFEAEVQIKSIQDDSGSGRKFRTVYVILSNEGLVTDEPNFSDDTITGIGNIGNQFKFKMNKKIDSPQWDLNPNSDEVKMFEKKFSNSYSGKSHFKTSNASYRQFKDHTFINLHGSLYTPNSNPSQAAGFIVQTNDDIFYDLSEYWPQGDYSTGQSYRIYDFIQDFPFVILKKGMIMHECSSIYLIKENKVWRIQLHCDGGGC